jgi:hypothetical protein
MLCEMYTVPNGGKVEGVTDMISRWLWESQRLDLEYWIRPRKVENRLVELRYASAEDDPSP